MSTYNNNIPQATDVIANSQGAILGNFQSIATLVAVNHAPFNSTNQGKHNFVEMPAQSPVPTTVAGEVGLYCQTSALTGVPALVFAPQSAGTPVEFTSSLQATAGWTRFPSGILLKWGQNFVSGQETVTFPTGSNIPIFANLFNVYLQGITTPSDDPNNACYITDLTTTSFGVLTTPRTSTGTTAALISYLAIGN